MKSIKGRIHYVDESIAYLSRGRNLLKSLDSGDSWQHFAKLPVRHWRDITASFALSARLLRSGFHHVVPFDDRLLLSLANRDFYKVGVDGKAIWSSGLVGSRPLALCRFGKQLYYGEYRSNPERSPVSIWSVSNENHDHWHPAWRFDSARHIHSVHHDSFTDSLWVTTGDTDEESAIWQSTDNFATIHKICGGSQQLRVVQLLFDETYVYFGSDAPNEPNHIYRLHRHTHEIETLAQVGGSVFYSCKVGKSLFFSTAVEPSKCNLSPNAEIWRSDDGAHWYRFLKIKKDLLPMKLFQYGQILFPAGCGDNETLWITPYSTHHHGRTFRINVADSIGSEISLH